MSDARTAAFKKLKPACVVLSKVALHARSTGKYGHELTETLENLRRQLVQIGKIDAEIASYAFFPMSHILHGLKSLPLPTLDLTLECIRLLIVQGWTLSREAGLCKQLLVLISFIIDPSPAADGKKPDFGDVVKVRALRCLIGLFGDARGLVLCLCQESKEEPLPILGQAISSALAALNTAGSFEIQNAAAEALGCIADTLKDETILRSFFPGVVSGLTRYLQPRTSVRRPYKAIVSCLDTLRTIINACFQDARGSAGNMDEQLKEWREQQSPQLQKALSQVFKLKGHDREEVLRALLSLCLSLLEHCRSQLGDISQLMVDVALYVGSTEELHTNPTTLEELRRTFSEAGLSDMLLKSLQEWLTALPRLAHISDPEKLARHLRLVNTAYKLMIRGQEENKELAKMLIASIEQACAIALQETSTARQQPVETTMQEASALTVAISKEIGTTFSPLGHNRKGHGKALSVLADEIRELSQNSQIRNEIAARPQSLESLWMSKCSLQSTLSIDTAMNEFMDSSLLDSGPAGDLGEALYSQALNILSVTTVGSESDWRAQIVALEVIALTSQAQKTAFAPELIDVLFPVLERIGSSELEIREHALICLNILAESCGASNAGQLVVQNADYLINSVAQRLNVPEISPQTPRVLLMVIQLSGPSLIPYLDDTMNSIFEILDDYHGYYGLVDPLFAVLEAIVTQASAPTSKLLEGATKKHNVDSRTPLSLRDVEAAIEKFKERGDDLELEDSKTDQDRADAAEAETSQTEQQKDKPESLSKPYQMVQSIARHCQHYLTHESPDLRRRLLNLLASASLALYMSEDQYLPLINDVWPVIITRLGDDDPQVAQAAMQTLSTFFECAGDFLSTRMRDAWPSVLAVGKRLRSQADARNKGKGGRGQFSLTLQLVDEFVRMLSYLAGSTGMSSEMEDDIFDILGPYNRQAGARGLLQRINADALWLLDVRATPAEVEAVNRRPPGYSGLEFRPITL